MTTAPKVRHLRLLQNTLLMAAGTVILAACCGPLRAQDAPARSSQDGGAIDRSDDSGIRNAQPRGKKLFLTDGNYQIVREYQRQGDRVRYYSLERSAWEEIPASLVDWAATQKAEAEEQAEERRLDEKVKAAARAAIAADIANIDKSIEVKPGLFLPDEQGFYIVDGSQITVMGQSQIETHTDKGRAIEKALSGVALINDKFHIEIAGKRAKLRVASAEPEFYFRPSDGREPRLSLIRTDVKGDKREALTAIRNVVGDTSYKSNDIPLMPWDAASGVYRYTIDTSLQPGEYAIIEMVSDTIADYVWDFGVDPGGKTANRAPAKTKAP
jgi:hypothetical protein